MKDRIQTLLLKKHLSPQEFANRLNMNRSNVSHLLSGRSKLSIDNLAIFMKEFPDISMEWLLLGEGNMFKSTQIEPINVEKSVTEVISLPIQEIPPEAIKSENKIENHHHEEVEIEKIIIFYNNKTYESYKCK